MSASIAPLARRGVSSFAAVIDVQPDVGGADDGRSHIALSQCARCSLVDFLRARRSNALDAHPVLASIVGFFDRLPRIEEARAAGNARALSSACADFGVRRVFTVDDGRLGRPLLDLPRVHVVGAAASMRLAGAEWALVSPGRDGLDRVRESVSEAVRAGVTRILVGYHSHAAANEHWSDFAGAPGFEETWPGFVRSMFTLGVTELVLLMPYPACAILQWREHRPLEAVRARLDLQLRRAGAESSMMCPENVSGYALFNDTRRCAKERSSGARHSPSASRIS